MRTSQKWRPIASKSPQWKWRPLALQNARKDSKKTARHLWIVRRDISEWPKTLKVQIAARKYKRFVVIFQERPERLFALFGSCFMNCTLYRTVSPSSLYLAVSIRKWLIFQFFSEKAKQKCPPPKKKEVPAIPSPLLNARYTPLHLHISKVCPTECGFHGETVRHTHLTPHDHTSCAFFALAHFELAFAKREVIWSLKYSE